MKIFTYKYVLLLFVMGASLLFSAQLSAQCTSAAVDLPDNGFPVDGNSANAYCIELTYDPAVLGCATGINMDLAHDYQGDLGIVVNACGNTLNVLQRPGTTECDAGNGGIFGGGFGNSGDIGTPPNTALVNVDFDDANGTDPDDGIAGGGGSYGVTADDACGIGSAGIDSFADLCAACPPGEITMQICITDHSESDAGAAANIGLNTPTTAICGCTDNTATNFNASANLDDGSCIFPVACSGTPDFTAPTAVCSGAAVNWTADGTCAGIFGPAAQDGGLVVDLFVYAPGGMAAEAPAGYEATIDVSSPTHTADSGVANSINVKDPNLVTQGFDFLCSAPPTAAGFTNNTCDPITITYFLAVFDWSNDTDGDLNTEYEPNCSVLRYDVIINPAPFTLTEVAGACGTAATVQVRAADNTLCSTITGTVPATPACTPTAGTTTNSEPLTGTYNQPDPESTGCYSSIAYSAAADCASQACPCNLGMTLTIVEDGCPSASSGSITINATGGVGTLQYSNDNGTSFQASNIFTGLQYGSYDIVVQEVANPLCTATDVAVIGGGTPDFTAPTSVCSGGAISWTAGANCAGIDGGTDGLVMNLFVYESGGVPAEAAAGFESTIDVSAPTETSGTEGIEIKNPDLSNIANDFTCASPPSFAGYANQTCDAFTVTFFLIVFDNSRDSDSDTNAEYQPNCSILRYDVIINPAPFTLTEVAGSCGTAATVEVRAADNTLCSTITGNTPTTACTPIAGSTTVSEPLTGTYTQADPEGTGCYTGQTYDVAADCASEACPCDLTGMTLAVVDDGCPSDMSGSITITATGGMAPLQYSIDGGTTFQSSNTFTGLTNGSYNVVIEEVNNFACTTTEVAIVGGGTIDFTVSTSICSGDAISCTAGPECSGINSASGVGGLTVDLFAYAPGGTEAEAPTGYTIDVSAPTEAGVGGMDDIVTKNPELLNLSTGFTCANAPIFGNYTNQTCEPYTLTFFIVVYDSNLDSDSDSNPEYKPDCSVARYDVIINPEPHTLTPLPGGGVEVRAADGTICTWSNN